MNLITSFPELEQLLKKMGLQKKLYGNDVEIAKTIIDKPTILPSKTEPIDIEILINKTPDNVVFEHDGRKVLVYIKAQHSYFNNFHKFHFYKCQTLKRMERQNNFDDHYVSTDRDDGLFFVDIPNGNNKYTEELRKLDVCQHCLRWYNNKNHHQKDYTVSDFDIETFFKQFSDTPLANIPTYTDRTAPQSGYPENWNEISLSYKERHYWICQQCHIDLKNHKNLLHVHHKRSKYQNNDIDLIALCVKCHSEQSNHQHMRARFAQEISEIETFV